MKTALPDIMSTAAFEPADLAIMQSVFEQVCSDRQVTHEEQRAGLALAILDAYKRGVRDRTVLLDIAMGTVI